MTHILIGLAAGVVVFLVCAGLRWVPAHTAGKVVLLVYLLAVGGWAGASWGQFATKARIARQSFSPERFEGLVNEAWPAPRPKQVTAAEIDRVLKRVVQKAAPRGMGPQEVQALLDAGKEMVGERRLIGTDGYADSQEIEVFIGAILPARLRDRIINRFPDEKTRLFAIACLLGVVGIFAGAIMSRARRVAPAD